MPWYACGSVQAIKSVLSFHHVGSRIKLRLSGWQQAPLPTKPSCRPGRKNSVQPLHGFQFIILHGKLHTCYNSERVCMRGGRGRKKAAIIFKLSRFSSLRSDLNGICSQRTESRTEIPSTFDMFRRLCSCMWLVAATT